MTLAQKALCMGVMLEDFAQEWATLTLAQKALCRGVMQEDFAHVPFWGISKLSRYAQLTERIVLTT